MGVFYPDCDQLGDMVGYNSGGTPVVMEMNLASCPDSLAQPSTVQRSPASAGAVLYFPSRTSRSREKRESTVYPRKSLMNQINEKEMTTERVVRDPMINCVQCMLASTLYLSGPHSALGS
jgi:hypothetical protein